MKNVLMTILLLVTVTVHSQEILQVNAMRWGVENEWESNGGIVVVNDKTIKISIGQFKATAVVDLTTYEAVTTDEGAEYEYWIGKLVYDDEIETVSVFFVYQENSSVEYTFVWGSTTLSLNCSAL